MTKGLRESLTSKDGCLRRPRTIPLCRRLPAVATALALSAAACVHRNDSGAEDSGAKATESKPAPPSTGTLRAGPREVPEQGLQVIDRSDLRARLAALAADSMEGRRAGTRGGDKAAAYLASELEKLGVEPAGDASSYLQRFHLPPTVPRAERDSTQNVVGIVRGSDPRLADEYVAIGAHYDHVGIGAPVDGDSIYNGADDDASGTVSVLEVAEALTQGPRPRRSVLLVFHGGEEAGLLGSQHFTDRPPVPIEEVVAQLNVDMVGRNSPDSLSIIGAGRISSELDRIIRREAAAGGLSLDYTLDAPDHPEQLYYRSDHYNYARLGIPVAFLFAGLHPDYHLPSDEIERIDMAKVERAAELLYRVLWAVAERPERLERDRAAPPPTSQAPTTARSVPRRSRPQEAPRSPVSDERRRPE